MNSTCAAGEQCVGGSVCDPQFLKCICPHGTVAQLETLSCILDTTDSGQVSNIWNPLEWFGNYRYILTDYANHYFIFGKLFGIFLAEQVVQGQGKELHSTFFVNNYKFIPRQWNRANETWTITAIWKLPFVKLPSKITVQHFVQYFRWLHHCK